MLNKLIKALGGYTETEFVNKCEQFKNSFDEIIEDEIKINDNIYFYHVSRIDYQTSRYHTGVVTAINSKETSDGTEKSYSVKCTDSTRFRIDLRVDIGVIAHSKRKLRDKIVNSDKWTFLTFMEYHNIEKNNQ